MVVEKVEERFNEVEPRLLSGDPSDCTVSVPKRAYGQPSQMQLAWGSNKTWKLFLDVSEARDLLEWLKTAVPAQETGAGT